MDEAKRLEIQAWIFKAQQDLRSAVWLAASPDRLYNAVGFHCQQAAATLTPYAVTFRYPGELPELSGEEAELAITLARQILEFGLHRLPLQTHPEKDQ